MFSLICICKLSNFAASQFSFFITIINFTLFTLVFTIIFLSITFSNIAILSIGNGMLVSYPYFQAEGKYLFCYLSLRLIRTSFQIDSFRYTQDAPQSVNSILPLFKRFKFMSLTSQKNIYHHPLALPLNLLTATIDFLTLTFRKTDQMIFQASKR